MSKRSKATSIVEPECPECEKMSAVQAESNAIGQFLDWLQEQEIYLCKYTDRDDLCLVTDSVERLLAGHFDIDLDKAEEEKRELLAYCRLKNAERPIRKELGIDGG